MNGRVASLGRGGRILLARGSRNIRKWPRYPLALDGTMRTEGEERFGDVRFLDLSSGGARISAPVDRAAPSVGAALELRLIVPGSGAPLARRGVVVRVLPSPETLSFGVAFDRTITFSPKALSAQARRVAA